MFKTLGLAIAIAAAAAAAAPAHADIPITINGTSLNKVPMRWRKMALRRTRRSTAG
jgi:hypothetical protein